MPRWLRRSTGPEPSAETSGGRPLAIAWTLFTAAALSVLAANIAWAATGGSIFVVSSSSMSPAAPVGSLVLVRPQASVAVGDVITFRPDGHGGETYTHRVAEVLDGPLYRTKGDLNRDPDLWVVRPADIIGTASAIMPGAGYLVKALPWLAIGTIIVLVAASSVRRGSRFSYGILAFVLLVVVPLMVWKPLVRGEMVSSAMTGKSDMHLIVVNTGLMPVDFSIKDGDTAFAAAGHPVAISGPLDEKGDLWVAARVALEWWGWLIVILACLAPTLLSALWAWRHPDDPEDGQMSDSAAGQMAAVPA
jgi:signal peptidase I